MPVTVRVTDMVTGLFAQEVDGKHLKVIVPEYVPVAMIASALLLMEIVSVSGVVPLSAETCSQLPPEGVVALAENVIGVLLLELVTCSV